MRDDPGASLADVAWTLQTGRSEHGRRRYAVVTSVPDAVRVLSGEAPDRLVTAAGESRPRPVLLRFAPPADPVAERAVWARLSAADPEFRRAVEECGAPSPVADDAESCAALAFAGRYALARDWLRRGAGPAGVVGTGPWCAAAQSIRAPASHSAPSTSGTDRGPSGARAGSTSRTGRPPSPVAGAAVAGPRRTPTQYAGSAASAAEAALPSYAVRRARTGGRGRARRTSAARRS
ncbi:CurL C-terminal domain-containing protein, partial [Streptomyces sp. MS191]